LICKEYLASQVEFFSVVASFSVVVGYHFRGQCYLHFTLKMKAAWTRGTRLETSPP